VTKEAPALAVKSVWLRFGGRDVLRNVSLTVGKGELVGVVGGNGAGKTSLANVVAGYYTVSQGHIEVNGKVLSGTPRNAGRMGVRRSFQSVAAFSGMSLMDFVLLGREPIWCAGLTGVYFGTRRSSREEGASRAAVLKKLATVPIKDVSEHIEKCSYGERKLADVLRAILGGGTIVLLDEPTSGLSSAEKGVVREEILHRRDAGLGIIVIDHDIAFVRSMCDRMIGLVDGKVAADGTPAEVLKNDEIIASFVGAEELPVGPNDSEKR
jgi:branched-chain amino acid transport system ATP-binding protein